MSHDLIIVGAGLAGSMVAKYAQDKGLKPIVLDDGNDWAASRASSNLSTPSWIKSLGELGEQGLENLRKYWPVDIIPFNEGKMPAYYLAMDNVLWRNPYSAFVIEVGDGWVKTDQEKFEGVVVVAAGVWSEDLLSIEGMQSIAGHTFIFKGIWNEPLLKLWAPYRHLKVFQWLPNLIMFGDSTAVLNKNYSDRTQLTSLQRARALGLIGSHTVLHGLRPVVKGKKVVCEQRGEKLWLLTGGGKMGMTVYASAAKDLVERICNA